MRSCCWSRRKSRRSRARCRPTSPKQPAPIPDASASRRRRRKVSGSSAEARGPRAWPSLCYNRWMADDLDITLDVSIREIVDADLEGLHDWYGPARDDSFRRSFERHRLGEVVYLVALLDGKPVGHLGIDLVRVHGAALLWQFGVLPSLQSRGIGT